MMIFMVLRIGRSMPAYIFERRTAIAIPNLSGLVI